MSSNRFKVVVVGGGQAGLAMSYCLKQSKVDHLVIDKGLVADTWRGDRWDSLLTHELLV